MTVYCYIGSLRNRNFEYDYRVVDSEGMKMTVNDKQKKDEQKVN
jgi:hypothetical protein